MDQIGRVAILLATYNGEKYLNEQIRSILGQTHRDFIVLVRDDHSNDRTPQILTRWSAVQPDKIRIVSDGLGNLHSLGNFSRLLEVCEEPYFAFCDQDDVWLPNKIELMMNEALRLEAQFGKEKPILVHSDLRLVDEDLREIAPSFFAYQRWDPNRRKRLRSLLFDNLVTGCALLGNRSLLELARPIPDGARHHDWWVALVAAACGVLSTVAEPTILYRQHGRNVVGAGPRLGRKTLRDLRWTIQQPRKLKAYFVIILRGLQIRSTLLLSVPEDRMSRRHREFLRAVSLPRTRDAAAVLTWPQRARLFVRCCTVYLRLLPAILDRCVSAPHVPVVAKSDAPQEPTSALSRKTKRKLNFS